jgi:hypothetical protein
MRHTRQAVLAALALSAATACMSARDSGAADANAAKAPEHTATVPATEEERQREIERRSAVRGKDSIPVDAAVAPAAGAESAGVMGEVPDAMLAQMRADLAKRVGHPVDAARLVRAEQVVWPDGSIGCAQPGVVYTQATVPGYLVEFELDGKRYRYHAPLNGNATYCEKPGPFLKTLGPDR